MNPIKAVDGQKFNTGNIVAWVSTIALLLNLSPEQVDALKDIITDSEYVYGLVFGAVVAAVGLMHKVVKVAGPLIEWWNDWTLRRAMK